MKTKASEKLAQARDRVAKGWYQGDYEDGDGNVCALGALFTAFDWMQRCGPMFAPEYLEVPGTAQDPRPAGATHWVTAVKALRTKINEVAPEVHPNDSPWDWQYVAHYNDLDETTLEDMINVFDKAIIGLEEQGR